MGCDIHFHVEKRTADGWERAEEQVKNEYFGQWEDEPRFKYASFYDGRNYSLFAMLADVRNGYGVAGVDRGDAVIPIGQPRGLPEDVSNGLRQDSDQWGADGHSHSWFSLRELLAVNWFGNTITHRGWVVPGEFDRWRKVGKPGNWCGDVSGGRVRHVSNDEMARMVDGLELRTIWNRWQYDEKHGPQANDASGDHFYTQVQWTEPWASALGEFMSTLVRMAGVAVTNDLSQDDVRAVFWFDN